MTAVPPEEIDPGEPIATPAEPANPPVADWTTATQRPVERGPVAGLAYAGVGRRLVAYIIDFVLFLIATLGFGILLGIALAIGGASLDPNDPVSNTTTFALSVLVSAGYFILAWRQRGATLGMKWLGLFVGNETDGARLSWGAAFIRWLAITTGPIPAIASAVAPAAEPMIGLLVIVWWGALLLTTATSPTKQGLHDRWAHSLLVKRV